MYFGRDLNVGGEGVNYFVAIKKKSLRSLRGGGGGGGKGEMVDNYMYTCINLHVQNFGSLK